MDQVGSLCSSVGGVCGWSCGATIAATRLPGCQADNRRLGGERQRCFGAVLDCFFFVGGVLKMIFGGVFESFSLLFPFHPFWGTLYRGQLSTDRGIAVTSNSVAGLHTAADFKGEIDLQEITQVKWLPGTPKDPTLVIPPKKTHWLKEKKTHPLVVLPLGSSFWPKAICLVWWFSFLKVLGILLLGLKVLPGPCLQVFQGRFGAFNVFFWFWYRFSMVFGGVLFVGDYSVCR